MKLHVKMPEINLYETRIRTLAKAVGAEIMVSVANSYGVHENGTGVCYIMINNSQNETTEVAVPAGYRYTLSSDKLRSRDILLNGVKLVMPDKETMPKLQGEMVEEGT